MTNYITGPTLGQALYQLGLIPAECGDVEILVPADGVLQLRCTIYVKQEDMPKIAQAFQMAGIQS